MTDTFKRRHVAFRSNVFILIPKKHSAVKFIRKLEGRPLKRQGYHRETTEDRMNDYGK